MKTHIVIDMGFLFYINNSYNWLMDKKRKNRIASIYWLSAIVVLSITLYFIINYAK